MKKLVMLVAVAPLALTGCNFGLPGGNGSNTATASNLAAPEVVPDSVTVNGVTYVRAGLDKIAPASATPTPSPLASALPPPISDSGLSVPPNTNTAAPSDASAAHGE